MDFHPFEVAIVDSYSKSYTLSVVESTEFEFHFLLLVGTDVIGSTIKVPIQTVLLSPGIPLAEEGSSDDLSF